MVIIDIESGMRRLRFYRAVVLGFAGAWVLPEAYFCEIMLRVHQLKQ